MKCLALVSSATTPTAWRSATAAADSQTAVETLRPQVTAVATAAADSPTAVETLRPQVTAVATAAADSQTAVETLRPQVTAVATEAAERISSFVRFKWLHDPGSFFSEHIHVGFCQQSTYPPFKWHLS